MAYTINICNNFTNYEYQKTLMLKELKFKSFTICKMCVENVDIVEILDMMNTSYKPK